MTKHNFSTFIGKKKLEKLLFFSATHKITYIAGYLLSTRKDYVFANVGRVAIIFEQT